MAGAMMFSSLGVGCRQSEPQPVASQPARTDVPLRVVLCGTPADQQAISRAWASVNSLPLDIKLIPIRRQEGAGWMGQMVQAAEKSDVIIYPLLAVAELTGGELLTALSDDEVELAQNNGGPFLAALRSGVSRFGGRNTGAPLGALQPAVISADEIPGMETWSDYDKWVGSLGGVAAEPLADGWAAAMFLWRAASTLQGAWLFDQDLDPQIDNQYYQDTLAQMAQTAKRYQLSRSSPEQIWAELKSGSLRGGLSFVVGEDTSDSEFNFATPPATELSRLLIDPFSPVISLSAHCRQSAASKQFIRWISGGEGSDSVRREVMGMTPSRNTGDAEEGVRSSATSGYDRWLQERLMSPNTLPTLQLLAADEYYRVLDQQVVRCLQGKAAPAQVLGEVKKAWQQLHQRVGLEKQQRAWRRAQGMSA